MLMRENLEPDIMYGIKIFSLQCEQFSMRTSNSVRIYWTEVVKEFIDNHVKCLQCNTYNG